MDFMGVLHSTGYIQQVTVSSEASKAFITITDSTLSTIIQATAPLTGVSIKMATDTSITKALNKDFLISAFGDQPVDITISGMQITYIPTGCTQSADQSVMKFYHENKVSVDATKRIKVSITAGGTSAKVFVCALMNLDIEADTRGAEHGYCLYRVKMLGVAE